MDSDAGHEGAPKPMMSLKGGCAEAHTQEPRTSEAMTNPRSASEDAVLQKWDTTIIPDAHPSQGGTDRLAK